MGSLSAQDKQEIHDDLVNRVATWVTGPRVEVVLAIAARVLGEEEAETPQPEPPAEVLDKPDRK